MDVLDQILDSLRLTGGVVVDARAKGEWCMISQFTHDSCAAYFPVPGTIIGYHYIRAGELWAEVEGHPPIHVTAGEILVFPRNDRHVLYTSKNAPAVDADDLLTRGEPGTPATIVIDGEGDLTEIYCGFLGLSEYKHHLFDALPPILLFDASRESSEWVASSMRYLSHDRSHRTVASLAELFVAEAIRHYVDGATGELYGWVGGLKDPVTGRALSIIQSRYAEDLDLETLAKESGVSRSALTERFAQFVGEPPMRYCARWRMRVAANMLRDGRDNTANISYAVGFNSEAAFNRAFKREFGTPPGAWKRLNAGEVKPSVAE